MEREATYNFWKVPRDVLRDTLDETHFVVNKDSGRHLIFVLWNEVKYAGID